MSVWLQDIFWFTQVQHAVYLSPYTRGNHVADNNYYLATSMEGPLAACFRDILSSLKSYIDSYMMK